jgi:hypothetical protein
MKSSYLLVALFLALASCAVAQGKGDANMRQIRRDQSPPTVKLNTHHSVGGAPASKGGAAATANSELTKLENSQKVANTQQKRKSTAYASLPKEAKEGKAGNIVSVPAPRKNKMTTNSASHSRAPSRAKGGRSH